jgi:putative flippase GtrA
MVTFIKAQASALIASLLDFITTIFLTEVIDCWYLIASIIGTILGGVTNFMISRRWVFTQGEKEIPEQILKYMVVWIGYLLLNALGVYVITHYLNVNYVISKMAVSIILGTTYNYFLQKRFVFK